jgi:uncharacterized protein (TIGR02246 family)
MKSYQSAALLSILAVAAACAPTPPAPPDAAAIRAALTAQVEKFLPAMQKKDVATIAALFTDDATWVLPDASTFKGRAEIEKGGKAFIESYESVTPGTMTIDRLVVISDSAALTFSRGTYSITMKGKKKVENHANPFADYWQKGADGVWRIAYEVNADGIVPDAPAAKP